MRPISSATIEVWVETGWLILLGPTQVPLFQILLWKTGIITILSQGAIMSVMMPAEFQSGSAPKTLVHSHFPRGSVSPFPGASFLSLPAAIGRWECNLLYMQVFSPSGLFSFQSPLFLITVLWYWQKRIIISIFSQNWSNEWPVFHRSSHSS